MNQLSLFAGIEGFGLAGSWLGWSLKHSVEKDQWCRSIITKNFPNTKVHGEIERFKAKKYRGTIDIVTGGFPCQSFSLAGKGKMDLSLWKEMLRTIIEVQSRWVVVENVPGLARRGGVALETVCTDLEDKGFEVFPPVIIPACAVGAPHRRDRIWIVAHSNEFRQLSVQIQKSRMERANKAFDETAPGNKIIATNNSKCIQKNDHKQKQQKQQKRKVRSSDNGFDSQRGKIEPAICGVDDGLSDWVDQIKALGNAIVPQLFFEIGNVINQMEKYLASNETQSGKNHC